MERGGDLPNFSFSPKWSLKPRGAANKIVAYNPLAINKNATQPRNRTHKKHRRAIHAANVPSRAPAMLFTAPRILFFCSRRPPFSIRTGERRAQNKKSQNRIVLALKGFSRDPQNETYFRAFRHGLSLPPVARLLWSESRLIPMVYWWW